MSSALCSAPLALAASTQRPQALRAALAAPCCPRLAGGSGGGARRRRQAAAAAAGASEAFGSVAQAAAADQAAAEVFRGAQEAAASDPTDLVFTVLFTVAVAALSVVTLGVAYLSFTSWNDSRLEAADRARFDSRGYGGNGATPPKSNPAKAAAKAGKADEPYKGFGKK